MLPFLEQLVSVRMSHTPRMMKQAGHVVLRGGHRLLLGIRWRGAFAVLDRMQNKR
jgi:hypothetical protein